MTATTKRSLFIILITCLLSACNTELSKDVNGSFGILGIEIGNKTVELMQEIDNKIAIQIKTPIEISKDSKIDVLKPVYDSLSTIKLNNYHTLTEDFVDFLSEIEEEFISSEKNPLFQNDKITQKGEEYLGRTKLYSKEISKLWIDDFTKNKIRITLHTGDIQNIEGTKISHIAYYFDDLPTKGIIVYLRQKRYDVLMLEKDFLNDLIFQNLTTQLNSQH